MSSRNSELPVQEAVDFNMFHNSQMMADLEEAFNLKDTLGLDVTVKCGDASFKCSKFMLTARSPVFKSMFQSNMMESQTNIVNIENLKPEVVADMLQYIHTGISPNLKEMSQELLVAADRYQLEQLKTSCQEILISSLDAKNCISFLILSDTYNSLGLKEAAIEFATENLSEISSSCDWKNELADFPYLLTEIIETFSSLSDSLKGELRRYEKMSDRILSVLKDFGPESESDSDFGPESESDSEYLIYL